MIIPQIKETCNEMEHFLTLLYCGKVKIFCLWKISSDDNDLQSYFKKTF